jgi:uncharacterized protein YfaS (alpha-2-macroglobulin family)
MSYLRDNMNRMSDYGRILLAAAYARSGQIQEARRMLGEKISPVKARTTADHQEMYDLDSQLRTRAMYLTAWNEIDPADPNAAESAAELLRLFRQNPAYNTQEAGWILSSLADYFSFNYEEANPVLELMRGESERIAVSSGDETLGASVSGEISGLSVVNSGEGKGYVSWTRGGVPVKTPEAEDLGLSAVVRYYDSNGAELEENAEVERGQRLIGVVKINHLAGNTKDIVAVLPLAGGLEIENPRFRDASPDYEGYFYSSRSELRDDRLIIFADYFKDSFTWKFAVRAVTKGKFTLPPIAAEGMYSSGVRSIGRTSTITIK